MSDPDYVGQVLVYSIVGCPHCLRTKAILRDLRVPFTDISVDHYDPKVRSELFERTKKKTVPQVFFNEKFIGGNEDFQKLVQNKEEFAKMIEFVKNNKPAEDAPTIPDKSLVLDDAGVGDFTCEPDEYAMLVHDMKKAGIMKNHRSILTVYSNSFTGKEFVQWLMNEKGLDKERAMEMGQMLICRHFGHPVKRSQDETFREDDTIYRLLEDEETDALNAGTLSECEPRPAAALGEDLRKLILKIYSENITADGRKVNYKQIADSEEFKKYTRLTKELHRVDVLSASREEKLAFFINVYNALVIHANIVKGAPTNLFQRWKFFNTVRYVIGGNVYNLQDIENGVLRGNRKGVAQFSKPFGKDDPRLKVALKEHEPLIHFALVCGAKSCPPIKTYSAANIMEEVKLACTAFLETDDAIKVKSAKNAVALSMIFRWYREDFGNNDREVVQWIEKNMEDGAKSEALRKITATGNFKITHMSYDWGVNS